MATKKKMLQAAAGAAGGEALAIEDVFSTYLYTGNGSTQTITNGIDLAGEGGLVWIKDRDQARENVLQDTERGTGVWISSNLTNGNLTNSQYLTQFNSDGFNVGTESDVNFSGESYASWTFRKAPRFFDVVTYTGTGSDQTVSHNLGVAPGCIIVKRTDAGPTAWFVYHRGLSTATENGIRLNLTSAAYGPQGQDIWGQPSDTTFKASQYFDLSSSGGTYVAYLFAHDPLGPSGDGSDGLIACGSYTGNGSSLGPEVNLGWEPQWVLFKRATGGVGEWWLADNMRGVSDGNGNSTPEDSFLSANSSGAESVFNGLRFTATGFQTEYSDGTQFNGSGETYIYIAIRRGPMRQPTSGTEVFDNAVGVFDNPSISSNFPVDFVIVGRDSNTDKWYIADRLRGQQRLNSATTDAETSATYTQFDNMDGFFSDSFQGYRGYAFRRAPGFFDVVAYTGNGVAGRTVPHNLGVAPELMVVKCRSSEELWPVYHAGVGAGVRLPLNQDWNPSSDTTIWNNTAPASDNFTLGTSLVSNGNGRTYIAYLFASLPGISHVGSYTGNGTSQTVSCGFTTGARFVLIRRTDSAGGDWYVWDTARGIVAANDPHLSLNTTAAEVTTNDSVDPDSSGFIVNQDAATNINVSSASYIFLAIA